MEPNQLAEELLLNVKKQENAADLERQLSEGIRLLTHFYKTGQAVESKLLGTVPVNSILP